MSKALLEQTGLLLLLPGSLSMYSETFFMSRVLAIQMMF